jgi:hypothetical protein
MINQRLVTQDLKLTLKLSTMINQHLSSCTKVVKHPIKECICYSLVGFVGGWHQLNPLGKVLHHHQHISIVSYYQW